MAGERKSTDLSSRLSVKRGAKIMSKSSKSSSIVSPPKATIASPGAKKDEVHRRKNPFNDMLRRGGRESGDRGKGAVPASPDYESKDNVISPLSPDDGEAAMGDRLAELERDLAVAKDIRDSLREELEKVEDQGQTDRATIEDLRLQLAEAKQQTVDPPSHVPNEHDRDDQMRLSTDQLEDNLLQQNYELRYRLAQVQDDLAAQDAMYRSRLEHETSHREAEWNELLSRLHMTEKESKERLQQLLSLKSSISSLTRMDSQITDSELGEAFSQLANRVREWVIAHYRRSKLDLSNLPPETVKALAPITPKYESIKGADRLALYQAIISSSLMQVFLEPIIIGLPTTGLLAAIRQSAEIIRGAATEYHEWRRVTIRALEKSQANHTITEGKERILNQLATDIGHILFTLTGTTLTPSAQTALLSILHTATDLQRTLAVQKAQYHLLFFNVEGTSGATLDFDDQRMEPINDLDSNVDEDGDTLIERNFLFCVFPYLEKFGDEWGENPETSNVLLKARVCCGVG